MTEPAEAAGGVDARARTDMLAVGLIVSTHGVHGELKVRSFSGEGAHLLRLRGALLRRGRTEKAVQIEGVRRQGSGLLLKVAGVRSPEAGRALVGFELWVPREQAAPLADNEYYAADLCRCRLWYGNAEVGRVRSVWDGGPTQLLEVESGDGRTFLVPFSEHFIGKVDVGAGTIELTQGEVIR